MRLRTLIASLKSDQDEPFLAFYVMYGKIVIDWYDKEINQNWGK